ncbi:unnamed protein product [Echinostoma caproni]|uniref:Amidase domain-containing protein n=1 Tax=Echinostoma caproni TaxID=27848 RepID=A0A182ZZC7_9TREM|nr:unnamed protein product [Echinostoma caproni]
MFQFPATKWNKGIWIVGSLGLAYLLSKAVNDMMKRRKWADRRARKKAEKIAAKAEFAQYLRENSMTPEEVEQIVSKSFSQLLFALKNGEITPARALLAYQHKAFAVDERCNCVVEFLYPDFELINLSGPLAGMPVSVKDNYRVKGHESYAGMSHFLTGPSKDDAVMISVLYSLGAVPFVRTNVPQAMLSILSWNPIDGVTLNPLALDRSPGGSSSGEAALIGGGGSILGFGTDLGGSIRLPAAMCNIVGFKPTPTRISCDQAPELLKALDYFQLITTEGPSRRDCTLTRCDGLRASMTLRATQDGFSQP